MITAEISPGAEIFERKEAENEKINGGPESVLMLLPIEQVVASPLNPRKSFTDAGMEALIESIRTHGLQQPIVVRPRRGPEWTAETPGLLQYIIIMGERRYRAHVALGLTEISALVRYDLPGEVAHIELALIENLCREDINVIEEAQGYRSLMRLGIRQDAIAARVSRSVLAISNTVRLLDLPEDVQALIASGEMSVAIGRALLKWRLWPDVISTLAKIVMAEQISSRRLESGLDYMLYSKLQQAEVIAQIPHAAEFRKTDCEKCRYEAYDHTTSYGYCFYPAHFRELKAVEDAQREEKAKNAIERATKGGKQIPHLRDLKSAASLETSENKNVPGCSASCECRGVAKDWSGAVVEVCLKESKLQSLKNKQTREQRRDLREWFALLERDFAGDLAASGVESPLMRRACALMAWQFIRNTSMDARRKVAKEKPVSETIRILLTTDKYSYASDTNAKNWNALAELPVLEQITLAMWVMAAYEIASQVEFQKDSVTEIDYVRGPSSSPDELRAARLAVIEALEGRIVAKLRAEKAGG